MKDYTMVVPTYWGAAGEDLVGKETIVFDHPTPLDEQGTLPRLLDSLDVLEGGQRKVVIIAAANNPRIAGAVRDKLEQIVAFYRSRYDIACMDASTLESIAQRAAAKGVSQAALGLLSLNNYASVRNMCCLAGILNASRWTIFIDDDEVFTDPRFLCKIEEDMQQVVDGHRVQALAGYYLQPDTYRLDESKVPAWRARHWNNTAAMNRAFDLFIGQGPRLKPTPFVFGGNMTLSLPLLKRAAFDPRITRGEDIDFLINLRIAGVTFYLDRELAIKHLPPGSSRPEWKKVREDQLRFFYERKKVRDHPSLCVEHFQPYPGMFLGDDLQQRAIKTNQLLRAEYEARDDQEGVKQCEANIEMARSDPFARLDTRRWLQQLTKNWQELAASLEGTGLPNLSANSR